jgi:hypothetical protein
VAADASGGVYLASASGTVRYPVVGGVAGTGTPLITAASSSVALARSGNVYVTPPTGPSVTLISTVGSVALPEAGSSTTPSSTADATITNVGNAPLVVTGYAGSITNDYGVNVVNFTGADGAPSGCVEESTAPAAGVPVGGTCDVVVTFDPQAGQQGTLTGAVTATSNAVAPVTIDTSGTGAPLTTSATAFSVASAAQVIDAPVSVTVTGSSTGPAPTGSVEVNYETWTVSTPATCATSPCGPTIYPVSATALATLTPSSSGTSSTASFNLAPVLAGTQNFVVGYTGDRTYGQSSYTVSVNVAKSAISSFIGDSNPPPYLPFVEEGSFISGTVPYDGSEQNWLYTMPVTVDTAAGVPTGTVTFYDNSQTCPPGTSTTGLGAAYCLLAAYKGPACPANVGYGVQPVVNNGIPSTSRGAAAAFNTECLQLPLFVTYSPVMATHYITPQYSGDANFLPATDSTSTLFQVLRSSLVNITTTMPSVPSSGPVYGPVTPVSLTVQPGSTASLTLYLSPLLGYGFQGAGATLNDSNFPLSLACDNLPPHTTCTFTYPTNLFTGGTYPYIQPSAPNSVQICPAGVNQYGGTSSNGAAYETLAENGGCNQNGTGTVTLTINTDVSTGTTTTSRNITTPITLATLFSLGTIGLFFRRKTFQKARRVLTVLLMIVGGAFAFSLSACNTTTLTPTAQVTTPPGTYQVSITGVQVGTQCVGTASTLPCMTSTGVTGQTTNGSENQETLPFYINLTVQ